MITILGAGGSIGSELATILAAKGAAVRLVSRNPKPLPGTTAHAADVTDREQTIQAVAGSRIVFLLVGLKYDLAAWRELWPRVMDNAIEACRRAGARLVFFDNVYMYGRVDGPMTEETPYAPCSKKGEVRARIATTLMEAVRAGELTAMIARSADFYGPDPRNSVVNTLVLQALGRGAAASWIIDAGVPHSLTFTPDAARGLALLIGRASAWNQVWHLPTAPAPPTGREFITMAAEELGVPPRFRVFSRPMLKVVGWFNPPVRESREMLYQFDSPYLVDATKFAREFEFAGTPYREGIRRVTGTYRSTPR